VNFSSGAEGKQELFEVKRTVLQKKLQFTILVLPRSEMIKMVCLLTRMDTTRIMRGH